MGLSPSHTLGAYILRVEDIYTHRQTIARFIKRFLATGTVSRKEGSGRPSKITDRVFELVEQQLRADDETTATQLHFLLTPYGVSITLSVILRSRTILGWTSWGSKYANSYEMQTNTNAFSGRCDTSMRLYWRVEDVIWRDEATVRLESHRRHAYRKKGERATLKLRPKHPIKVHV